MNAAKLPATSAVPASWAKPPWIKPSGSSPRESSPRGNDLAEFATPPGVFAEGGEKGVLLFVERGVTGIRQHDEARARDQRPVRLAEGGRHDPVGLAPDQQGRHVDPVQPFFQTRVVKARPVG